jgi:LuxR family maltose regulon positive regulatory protein
MLSKTVDSRARQNAVGKSEMTAPLLKTKLYIPPVRPELVPRPRLIERLNAGLWPSGLGEDDLLQDRFACKLTLVSAPAGFGKTALIAEWLQHLRGGSDQGKVSFAWLSLDEDDNDPVRFFTYLIAAIETVQADVGANAKSLFQSPHSPPLKTALTVLINDLATIPANVVLALDDYHVITQPAIHDALAFLVEHAPPQVRLVIASRADPPLPLARLRTRGQLTELRAADLRFTRDESLTFLNGVMALGLSAENVAALEARTEGWIAGLQLAALSMRGRADMGDFVAAFSGSHRHVIDYLAEEVLAQQPGEIHDFLCQTAILNRLTAPLCDAVTGRDDSDVILRQLEQANLFLIPLDDQREWYRYHRLFADFLRNHLQQDMPDRVRDLHCWAADWYEQHGWVAEAVGHAMEGGEFEWAARLIDQTAEATFGRGEMSTLLHWLKTLPDAIVRSRPRLSVFYAWTLIIAGELDDVEAHLQNAERGMQSDGEDSTVVSKSLLSQIAASRAYLAIFQGDVPRAAEFARRAYEHLSQDDHSFLHSIIAWLMGFTQYFNEGTAAAGQLFSESIELSQVVGNTLIALLSITTSALLQMMQGCLRQAYETLQQGLELLRAEGQLSGMERDRQPFLGTSLIYEGLGEVLREWNHLEDAERYLTQSIELGEQWGNAEALADAYIFLARLKQARGDPQGARDTIRKADQLVREKKVALWTARQIKAHQARLWVAQGNLEGAERWAALQAHAPEPAHTGRLIHFFLRWVEHSTMARLLIARRKFDDALSLIASLLQIAEDGGWMGVAIELLVLQALALHGQHKTVEALDALQRALVLAEPEGYVRTFVDEGAPMLALLREAAARGIATGYVNKLLTASGVSEYEGVGLADQTLIDPLSERELEVLHLIAAGLSNREIAERLVVAVSTVKTHINNIYRKLDVSKRTQAVARARELELL